MRRLFVTCMAPAVLIIPGHFCGPLTSGNSSSTNPPRRRRGRATDPGRSHRVDELPLVSLLDAHAPIDASNYPNFARLGRQAHWFRNATTPP
ncbi:MAG: hypothetical protein H0X67_07890 [Acidobacteria bacterium]|nr:hypothetical protein [Acidobacteriota bacterium]